MKTDDAKFLISNDVADPNLMGVFENSFRLSNYENFLKKEEEVEDASKEDDDFDMRTKKVRKSILNYEFIAEDAHNLESEEARF